MATNFRSVNRFTVLVRLVETFRYALKTMQRLLPEPPHDSRGAVAVRDVVTQGGKAMRLAATFHFRKLLQIEFWIFDRAPIVLRVVHGKTRR